MISRYEVWLNDEPLSSISPNIYIADIGYTAVAPSRDLTRIAAADGRLTGETEYIQENRINIAFVIREYNTRQRQQVLQDVIKWARGGGWLKTSDRIGQKIYVRVSQFPAIASVMRWTDNLTLEFIASDYPFWVAERPETAILTLSSSSYTSGQLYLPGAWKSYVEAKITAAASITGFTVRCGDTFIAFSGLSLSSGDVITISYTDDHHILEIKKGTDSILDKRTAASTDDVIAMPGRNNISFSGNGDATCEFKVREVFV